MIRNTGVQLRGTSMATKKNGALGVSRSGPPVWNTILVVGTEVLEPGHSPRRQPAVSAARTAQFGCRIGRRRTCPFLKRVSIEDPEEPVAAFHPSIPSRGVRLQRMPLKSGLQTVDLPPANYEMQARFRCTCVRRPPTGRGVPLLPRSQ